MRTPRLWIVLCPPEVRLVLKDLLLSQWTSLFPSRVNKLGRPYWLNILLKTQQCDHNWGMCTSRHRPSPCEAQRDSLSLGSNLSVSPHPRSNQSGARGLMVSTHNGLSWPFFSSQFCHQALSVVGVFCLWCVIYWMMTCLRFNSKLTAKML